MVLLACVSRRDSRSAFEQWRKAMYAGAKRVRANVGWQGESHDFDVHWRSAQGYWCLLHPNQTEDRYWCWFGTQNPGEHSSLKITCQINLPKEGVSGRTAGMFVYGRSRRLFVAHVCTSFVLDRRAHVVFCFVASSIPVCLGQWPSAPQVARRRRFLRVLDSAIRLSFR